MRCTWSVRRNVAERRITREGVRRTDQVEPAPCSYRRTGSIPLFLVLGWCGAVFAGEPKVKAFVSLPPQAYLVARVGGPLVEVEALVGPGQNPHTFEPTPKQMARLAEAEVYFRIGLPFEERLVERIAATFKNLRIVDTRKGIELRAMTEHDEDEPHHGAGEPDPHIWLDPIRLKTQARTICGALSQMDPPDARTFERNLSSLESDLDRVHEKIAAALAPLRGRSFFVFHPAFGYFADRYGLKQVPVEVAGKEPSGRNLARLIAEAKRQDVKVVFVQPQFSAKSAEAVAAGIGGAVVPLNDLAYDCVGNLEAIATALEKCLAGVVK